MHFAASVVPTDASLPINYAWNFGATGDGAGAHGPTPVFTYTESGTHTVAVAAINCGGNGSAVDTFQVAVQSTCRPLLGVAASVDGPVAWGEASHFHATITPTDATRPVDYAWTFGGAGTGTGLDGPDPVYTYTHPGAYTVTVTTTNCSGTGLGVASAEVQARVTCARAREIEMAWRPRPVYVGTLITFTASVGGGRLPLTYTWHFGDDETLVTGRQSVVRHTFDLSGTFPVTLTVANPCGTADPVAHLVDVVAMPDKGQVFLPLLLKQ
jgi:PKD repeat protein